MSLADLTHLSRARAAAEVLGPLAARIEAERRLPAEALRALVDAGVFKLVVPRSLGGSEASLPTLLAVLEEIACADGSAGWCAMVGTTSSLMSVFLDDDVAREVFAAHDAITCGVFAPMGRATPVSGGYRVSGRWAFASGCEHASWRMGGALVSTDGGSAPGHPPEVRSMLFRDRDTRVIDTWNTSGLRGTGSHDFEVSDVFVPDARSFSLLADKPRNAGPTYALPFFGVLAASVASVALGIARGAIDTFVLLAKKKHPLGAKRSIAQRELVQLHVAQAEGKVRAARAFLRAAVAEAEVEAASGGGVSLTTRALLRLAASHAASEAAAAVDLVYNAGGASSIYASSPLQRQFRDVHVATQHIMVSSTATILAGRILLGVESDVSML